MDRCDGCLEQMVTERARANSPIPAGTVLSIMEQIAAALAYLHDPDKVDANGRPLPGVVHRNLKPANVLISGDGRHVVLAGLGLCKDGLHNGSTFVRTEAYMAPETHLRGETSSASDIWALGAIAYELSTLKRPDFPRGQHPRDVFVDGWRPDLAAVEDDPVRSLLKKVFILDLSQRPTAKELTGLLRATSASTERSARMGSDKGHESLGCTPYSTSPKDDPSENRLIAPLKTLRGKLSRSLHQAISHSQGVSPGPLSRMLLPLGTPHSPLLSGPGVEPCRSSLIRSIAKVADERNAEVVRP
ncbi:Kinase, NEK [Giardia lamblia P15]|uniref:non-specific serine/threonine protein kinase n=1 Tax=Giardia intestinalis (strain P15) TaxID=658858 RepID=E1EYT8_GIAIA|nr:Kinase, NEK [Giardia lamblia P15]